MPLGSLEKEKIELASLLTGEEYPVTPEGVIEAVGVL
jgi:hypothetical protein